MPQLSHRRQSGNLNCRIRPRSSNLLSTGLMALAPINCKPLPPALHGDWQDRGNQELPFNASQAAGRWGAIFPALRSRSQAHSSLRTSSGGPRTLQRSEQEHHLPYIPSQPIRTEPQALSRSKTLLQQPTQQQHVLPAACPGRCPAATGSLAGASSHECSKATPVPTALC